MWSIASNEDFPLRSNCLNYVNRAEISAEKGGWASDEGLRTPCLAGLFWGGGARANILGLALSFLFREGKGG